MQVRACAIASAGRSILGMKTFDPATTPTKEVFDLLLGGVGPRPIALVSTISAAGEVNLSPFSFFNAFGGNPPTIAFSPSRRLRDNTTKHTFENLRDVPECVVQAVTYDMVQQVSLASTEYPRGVNEFDKSGLTPVPSNKVKPPRVAQSPFQMECRVAQIIELGGKPASGNLVICEVVQFHVDERLFVNGLIDPQRIDLVARMGGDFYARANGDAIFVVKKPIATRGIGYDQLPQFIRESEILSANNLGQLANVEKTPTPDEVTEIFARLLIRPENTSPEQLMQIEEYRALMRDLLHGSRADAGEWRRSCQRAAKLALESGDVEFAWAALLISVQTDS